MFSRMAIDFYKIRYSDQILKPGSSDDDVHDELVFLWIFQYILCDHFFLTELYCYVDDLNKRTRSFIDFFLIK